MGIWERAGDTCDVTYKISTIATSLALTTALKQHNPYIQQVRWPCNTSDALASSPLWVSTERPTDYRDESFMVSFSPYKQIPRHDILIKNNFEKIYIYIYINYMGSLGMRSKIHAWN